MNPFYFLIRGSAYVAVLFALSAMNSHFFSGGTPLYIVIMEGSWWFISVRSLEENFLK